MIRLNDVPERHREVAVEWFKGAEVQFSHEDNPGIWYNTDHPAFYPTFNYRVKPKPVECFANILAVDGKHKTYFFETAHDAHRFAKNCPNMRFDRVAVRMVEA